MRTDKSGFENFIETVNWREIVIHGTAMVGLGNALFIETEDEKGNLPAVT